MKIGIYNHYDLSKIENSDIEKFILEIDKSSKHIIENMYLLIKDVDVDVDDSYYLGIKSGIIANLSIADIEKLYYNNRELLLRVYKIRTFMNANKNYELISKNIRLKKNSGKVSGDEKDKFLKEIMDLNKDLIDKKDNKISQLEAEISRKTRENKALRGIIESYSRIIKDYNDLSFFDKVKNLFTNKKIDLLG